MFPEDHFQTWNLVVSPVSCEPEKLNMKIINKQYLVLYDIV